MIEHERLMEIDLRREAIRLLPGAPRGRRAETLVKRPDLRVVLVTMRAGAELREHDAPGTITVQPLQGLFAFSTGDEEREIAPGDLISLAAGVRHAVRAIDDGAFLLTLAWGDGDDGGEGDLPGRGQ